MTMASNKQQNEAAKGGPMLIYILRFSFKGSRMGHSVKVSLWCVALLINT